jgi:tetratricopeptide (TPR) repeat protein
LALDLGNSLAEAHRRLDPAIDGRRPTREDFEFALAAARKALTENPRSQDALFLQAFAKSGLAYLEGREPEAELDLAEALLQGRWLGNREASRLWFLQQDRGVAAGDKAWALAIALGDPKRTAGALLEKAIAEHPREARIYIGRAVLDRMDRNDQAAIADARTAHEKAVRAVVRCAAAELLAEELVRSGANDEALTWLRRAVEEAPSDVRGHLAMRAAKVARTKLSDEKAAGEFLRVACSSGNQEACSEIGTSATSEERPRLRPRRRVLGGRPIR